MDYRESIFTKKHNVLPSIIRFMKLQTGTKLSRVEVTKFITEYILKNNLKNSDGTINVDTELSRIFAKQAYKSDGTLCAPVNSKNMQAYLAHLYVTDSLTFDEKVNNIKRSIENLDPFNNNESDEESSDNSESNEDTEETEETKETLNVNNKLTKELSNDIRTTINNINEQISKLQNILNIKNFITESTETKTSKNKNKNDKQAQKRAFCNAKKIALKIIDDGKICAVNKIEKCKELANAEKEIRLLKLKYENKNDDENEIKNIEEIYQNEIEKGLLSANIEIESCELRARQIMQQAKFLVGGPAFPLTP